MLVILKRNTVNVYKRSQRSPPKTFLRLLSFTFRTASGEEARSMAAHIVPAQIAWRGEGECPERAGVEQTKDFHGKP